MRQTPKRTNLNTSIIKIIKKEFDFINSFINNNTFLAIVKEDSIAHRTKQSKLLLISLKIRALLKISELASIGREKILSMLYTHGTENILCSDFFVSVDFLDELKVT